MTTAFAINALPTGSPAGQATNSDENAGNVAGFDATLAGARRGRPGQAYCTIDIWVEVTMSNSSVLKSMVLLVPKNGMTMGTKGA